MHRFIRFHKRLKHLGVTAGTFATCTLLLASRKQAVASEETRKLSSFISTASTTEYSYRSSLTASSRTCHCEASTTRRSPAGRRFIRTLARRRTIRKIDSARTTDSLESKYEVMWENPIGEGSFGSVYQATNRETGEKFALKKMSKNCADKVTFQREMDALLHLKAHSTHPNICSLHENFEENDDYYFVLDLIEGGEMFEYLANNGPYSEADAARIMRELASALAFLHGIGIVHSDLKPGNIMLSTNHKNATVKLIDFGCADVVVTEEDALVGPDVPRAGTVAFCAPEALDQSNPRRMERKPSFDMWSLGIILHVMLTGTHPFDTKGDASPAEMKTRIESRQLEKPLNESPATQHLSKSAIDCIRKLLDWDQENRISALEMLSHPWVEGKTASNVKMTGSDTKLSKFRAFRSSLAAQVFANMILWSEQENKEASGVSLVERAFHGFDHEELVRQAKIASEDTNRQMGTVSLSDFDNLLSSHMTNRYYRKGQTIYEEGDAGHHMYIINSGTAEVTTQKGFNARLQHGDFFGEGALLRPDHIRSATVRCTTPLHVIEVSEEYFKKYMLSTDLSSKMNATDKTRKREMSMELLRKQDCWIPVKLAQGDSVYREGDESNAMYLVEEGDVDISVDGEQVQKIGPGEACGIQSLVSGRPRADTALCSSPNCKLLTMKAGDFNKLRRSSIALQESFRDVQH